MKKGIFIKEVKWLIFGLPGILWLFIISAIISVVFGKQPVGGQVILVEETIPLVWQYNLSNVYEALPQRDLVFGLDRDEYETDHIGFINANGTGLEIRKFTFTWEWKLGNVFRTWNEKGTAIASRFDNNSWVPSGGYPMIIHQDGTATTCNNEEFYNDWRFWVVDDFQSIIVMKPDSGQDTVVLLNMNTCEPTSVLYAAPPGKFLSEANFSRNGWLWIVSYSCDSKLETILINEAGEEVKVIANADYPSWSADGQWLSYWKENEGIYIEHRKEGEGHLIVKSAWPSISTWSPDGQWLAYDCDRNLMKVNIETGEQVLIFEGGRNPNWNWGMTTDRGTD